MINKIYTFSNLFLKISATRYDKENILLPSEAEILKRYITNSPPYNYLRLQDIRTGQLGINPTTIFATPVGICSYPLTTERYQKAIEGNHEFAGEGAYSYIFTAKNHGTVLYLDKVDLDAEVKKLKRIVPDPKTVTALLKESEKGSLSKTPGGRLFYITRNLVDHNPILWSKIFLKLGYTGLHDPGLGIIHENEPEQALFFGAGAVKELEILSTRKIDGFDPLLVMIPYDRWAKMNNGDLEGYLSFVENYWHMQLSITEAQTEYIAKLVFGSDVKITEQVYDLLNKGTYNAKIVSEIDAMGKTKEFFSSMFKLTDDMFDLLVSKYSDDYELLSFLESKHPHDERFKQLRKSSNKSSNIAQKILLYKNFVKAGEDWDAEEIFNEIQEILERGNKEDLLAAINSGSFLIKELVASNSETPEEILLMLTKDTNKKILSALSANDAFVGNKRLIDELLNNPNLSKSDKSHLLSS